MHIKRKRYTNRKQRRLFFNPPGAQPGLMVTPLDAAKPLLEIFAYSADGLVEKALDGGVGELKDLLGRWPVIWLNIDGLGDAELIRQIGDFFGFHRLAMEDVLSGHQRAKLEQYGDHLFLTSRMPTLAESLETEQFSLFVGRNYVVTFQELPGDCLDPVRERLRTKRGRIRDTGPDYLAYALIDSVIDSYFPVLEAFGERIDLLEDQIVELGHQPVISQIHSMKRDLLTLRRSVWPLREVTNSLIRDMHPMISDETRLYLRDCYDHTVRIIDLVENYRELAADLMDLFLSITSNRMNEIMKVLTIISTIFIPLSFIAGVYGMNFDSEASPWNMPELKWYYGYPFALAMMAALTIGLLIYFYRKGWLGGRGDVVRELVSARVK